MSQHFLIKLSTLFGLIQILIHNEVDVDVDDNNNDNANSNHYGGLVDIV